MKVPFTPPEPTINDKLWELFWRVNSYSGMPLEETNAEIEETMRWISNWLHENSDACSTAKKEGERVD